MGNQLVFLTMNIEYFIVNINYYIFIITTIIYFPQGIAHLELIYDHHLTIDLCINIYVPRHHGTMEIVYEECSFEIPPNLSPDQIVRSDSD